MADYCTHTFRKIINTHKWKNGSPIVTYRLRCSTCGFTWTVYYDRTLKKEVEVTRMSDSRPLNNRRLTPVEVRTILTDSRTGAELARFFGVSHQAVNQVRTGRAYRDLWPELPRVFPKEHYKKPHVIQVDPTKLQCRDCTHWWQGRCGLGVPEAGGAFADECSFYQKDE
jgi:hypothetical protein